jgi:hypothetical protein
MGHSQKKIFAGGKAKHAYIVRGERFMYPKINKHYL